ncbi:MAG: OadG family protein [Chromatocurvus sp.]
MSPTLFEQGVEIMLFGMGTVIAFLTLLVITMVLMSRLLEKLYPAATRTTLPASVPAPAAGQLKADELLAVITAAVHRHRQQSGKMHHKETSHG